MSYISIRMSTLRGDQKIDFNAYIKINDKMVLYLKQGDSFEGVRLQRLKDKKLRKMYIENSEESKYLAYLQRNIESAYDLTNSKDMQTRAEIIQGSQQGNVEEVFENADNAESYNRTKEDAGRYVQFILNNTDAVSALMNVENTDKSIAHHGVTVSTLAVSLAKRLKITDEKKIQLLALGALLHDFGHSIEPIPLNLPVNQMTAENQDIWKRHPQVGASSVQDKKHFDLTVLNIILQHEETSNGLGPMGLIEKNQDPLATIVSSANAMDRLLTFENVPRHEVTKKMMIEQVGSHPLTHIQHLSEIIKNL